MKKVYNKLIRDKIPEIISADNEIPQIRKLQQSEFRKELKKKVSEEAQELVHATRKTDILNEIVDIQELLDWLANEFKITKSEIKKYQNEKNKKRGSFKKKLFLIETTTNK